MGLLWDRNIGNGSGEVKKTEIPLDGSSMYITQFDRSTNTRVSWDTNGSIDGVDPKSMHFTNQNIKRGRPMRHRQ